MKRTYWLASLEADYLDPPSTRKQAPEADANLVSSLLEDGRHAPLLDLDVPARLVPSSTPGHSHLYVDVPMTWRRYRRLLKALTKAGLIERGFYRASVARRQTMVRKPGVKKASAPKGRRPTVVVAPVRSRAMDEFHRRGLRADLGDRVLSGSHPEALRGLHNVHVVVVAGHLLPLAVSCEVDHLYVTDAATVEWVAP